MRTAYFLCAGLLLMSAVTILGRLLAAEVPAAHTWILLFRDDEPPASAEWGPRGGCAGSGSAESLRGSGHGTTRTGPYGSDAGPARNGWCSGAGPAGGRSPPRRAAA